MDVCADVSSRLLVHELLSPLVNAVVGLLVAVTARLARQTREEVRDVKMAVNGSGGAEPNA